MLSALINSHPEILAVLLAASGFFFASVLARLADRSLIKLEIYLRHRARSRVEQLDLGALRNGLRRSVYYGTLVIFLLFSLHTLRISVVKEWLGLLLQYVPQLILGSFIILSGYLIGLVVRSLLSGLMGVSADHLVPRFVQLLIVTAAVLTGLAQTSIDISFISQLIVILLAFFFGGLSLAFALGSRQLVENLLARKAVDRYRIGDLVLVNDTRGKIIEILSTAVVLEAEQGLLTVPTSLFVSSQVLLLNEEEAHDSASGTV